VLVVLDTNVLISACWKADGLEALVLHHALAGSFTPAATGAIWQEYSEVLRRKKFSSRTAAVEALLAQLHPRISWIHTTHRLTISQDEDDNRFLECASAATAFLVTGNLRDYPEEFGTTKVRSARMFLNEANLAPKLSSASPLPPHCNKDR
jgi:putative PIN family toxin of toxin-antitoxin system